jgi:Uncharacterized protein conserved in archaea
VLQEGVAGEAREVPPKIELRWLQGFERWLTEKKIKPISQQTLKDYRSIWMNCLEGKELSDVLIRQLEAKTMTCKDGERHPDSVDTPNLSPLHKVLVLSWQVRLGHVHWLLLSVPSRKYGRRLSLKPIREEDVVKSLRVLKEKNRSDLLTIYLLVLASGICFTHILQALKTWSPDEVVYVDYLNRNIKRLECFESHCRYYLSKEREVKPTAFIFFPRLMLPLINAYKDRMPNKHRIRKLTKKWTCLPPKHIRVFALREMKAVLGDNDVYRFIVGKFGELMVSARHYMDLLREADQTYSKYVERWRELVTRAMSIEVFKAETFAELPPNTKLYPGRDKVQPFQRST